MHHVGHWPTFLVIWAENCGARVCTAVARVHLSSTCLLARGNCRAASALPFHLFIDLVVGENAFLSDGSRSYEMANTERQHSDGDEMRHVPEAETSVTRNVGKCPT